jgi:hypothetical protein
MRTSVFVGLLMIGLLAFGLRSQMRQAERVTVIEVARAQDPPPIEPPMAPEAPKEVKVQKGRNGKVVIPRTQTAPPLWKATITGDPKTTDPAARRDAYEKAARELGEWASERFPGFKYRPTPRFLADHRLVNETPVEEITLANAEAPTMFVQKLNLELHDHQLSLLLQEDRRERSVERLYSGGRILGGLIVALLALIGYVRLDDWTKGYFSTALKLSAIALVVATVVILLAVA